jgi:hypothetical protein
MMYHRVRAKLTLTLILIWTPMKSLRNIKLIHLSVIVMIVTKHLHTVICINTK